MRRLQGLEPKEVKQIAPGLRFYWMAFWDLMSCRSHGMGEGPIPWTAVDAYARRHCLSTNEFEDLWMILRRLDGHYLQHRAKQRAREDKG